MKFYLTLFLAFCFSLLSAQEVINVNPDPKGEPWYVGNLRKLTAEDYKKINETPKLKLSENYSKSSLPSSVDNSLNKYFRPIFNQTNGCCGQASGVGYNFTYAINFARDLASNTSTNQYPTHYTYNFLNGGADNGSFYFDGWEVINANGCPNASAYGGLYSSLTTWKSGYNFYYEAMKNRTLEVYTIDVSTSDGLQTLKQWMNDQLNGSSVGGLANFCAGVSGNFSMSYLPNGTPEAGKTVITSWDAIVNHAMTFVGYNDNIKYDFNGDGQYTNNKDIDGNGVLDMRDWEVGGLIMVNSWGNSFGDAGKAYVPYKLLAEPKTNGGIGTSIVHVLRAKATYTPKATIKATITHTSRGKLQITAGISSNPNATKPDHILQVPIFNFQGGSYYMKGGSSESDKTIEIGLDITPLLGYINSNQEARIFLVVNENDLSNTSSGTIGNFSVYDYTNGTSEVVCSQTNVPILNNDTTFLYVNRALTFNKVLISTTSLPDAANGFPYSFRLSAENGTSPYSWGLVISYDESKKTSTLKTITDNQITPNDPDDGFSVVSLPFSFPFYDNTYNKITITTDGSILFGDQFEYVRDNANLKSIKAITAYGADLMLYPADGDGIWYKSNNDSITIRWKISKYDNQSFNAEFSTTLFPSGLIRFNYGSGITSANDWTSGVSMGNGSSFIVSSLSGSSTINANQCFEYTTTPFPESLVLSEDGILSFTPKKNNQNWSITTKVTDLNKISAYKTLSIHSADILTFSTDTLKFNSPTTPDPWTTGKDITITNNYSQAVEIDTISWGGYGWEISSNKIAFPYEINAGANVTLNIRLKNSLTKSGMKFLDSLSVKTDNITYYLPITIDPSIYSTPTYSITFNVTNKFGAINGAEIAINNLPVSLTTNSAGVATINLIDGTYKYTVTYNNHNTSSGTIQINGSNQTLNISLIAMGTEYETDKSLRLFPNPFKNELTITRTEGSKICIYNLIGNPVVNINSAIQNQKIDTNSLPEGIYILIIEDRNGTKTSYKIIKN